MGYWDRDDSEYHDYMHQGPEHEDCGPTGPWVIQDDATGRILWMGEASSSDNAVGLFKMTLEPFCELNEDYITVTAITRALQREIEACEMDAEDLIEDFIYGS